MQLFMIQLNVANWPRALAWYRDVLGMRPTLVDESNRFALLEAGPVRIALKEGETTGERLVFLVDDLDTERRRLIDCGVAVGESRENVAEGYREIRLADPEGMPIRLFAWTGAEIHHKDTKDTKEDTKN
jgi:catechol 2,3-dioxygenase-like lactoylglutathione lyase family enzyme